MIHGTITDKDCNEILTNLVYALKQMHDQADNAYARQAFAEVFKFVTTQVAERAKDKEVESITDLGMF